jgi:hypothetical protein
MYVNGLNNVFEDDASMDPAAAAMDPVNGGGGSWWPGIPQSADINWTGALNTAINAWTAKNNADTQLEIAKMQQQQRVLPYSNIPGYYGTSSDYSRTGLSPFPGAAGSVGGLNTSTLLIIAALIAGGYFLLKD